MRPFSQKWTISLGLLGLCALLAAARFRTYHEPFEEDITWYAVVGHELLHGKQLYSEIWDQRPPLISSLYALAEIIAGYGPASVFLLNVVTASAVLVGIYIAGSMGGASVFAGFMAAALWAVLSGDPGLQGNQPNTELFINACLVWAFALLILPAGETIHKRRYVIAGILLALSTWFKPIVFPLILLFIVAHGLVVLKQPSNPRYRLLQSLWLVGVPIVSWVLLGGYFWLSHRLTAFVQCVLLYNHYYSTQYVSSQSLWTNLARSFQPYYAGHFLRYMSKPILVILTILLGIGFFVGCVRRQQTLWIYLVAYILGIHIAVSLPGHFYAHYYQLWLPPLLIGTAWALMEVKQSLILRHWLAPGFALILLGYFLRIELPYYKMSANEWSEMKYGQQYLATRALAQDIDVVLKPHETFFTWACEPGLYYWTRRNSPTVAINCTPLRVGPMADTLNVEVVKDLERTRPELFIAVEYNLPPTRTSQPVLHYIAEHYRPNPALPDKRPFLFLVRQGGELQKRLNTISSSH